MIKAKIIDTKMGKRIKLQFKQNDLITARLTLMKGTLYNHIEKYWTLPYSSRQQLEQALGDFLIIWEDEDIPFNGGIDEDTIPSYPIVPGYEVTYDQEGKVIDYKGFKEPPFGEFQVKGFNLLVERDFLILGDEMGLGKTYQVATAIEAKKKLGHLKRCLILAKASLLFNWRDEIHKFTDCKAVVVTGPPKQRHRILSDLCFDDSWTFLIMSYETFRITYSNVSAIDDYKPIDCIVLDEAQKIKSPLSKIGQAIHYIHFKYRYVLTATPLPNSPLEAFNYLKFGNKLKVTGNSIVQEWYKFMNRYAIRGGFNDREIVGYNNINELRKLIQDKMLRRLKKHKLKELPDVVFKDILLELPPAQRKFYDAIKKEIIEDLKETDLDKVPSMLAKLMRLQQVTSALENIGVNSTDRNNVKLVALSELLQEIMDGGGKVIVFSKFRPTIDLLVNKFKKLNPAVIHGDVDSHALPEDLALAKAKKLYKDWNIWAEEDKERVIRDLTTSDRQKEVYKFQENDSCRMFIGSIEACKEGLTLTAATHVVFIDYPWNWASYDQAFSRAHRIGQKNAVTVYNLICKDTVDEKVFNTIKDKKGMSESILDNNVGSINTKLAYDFIKSMI